MYGNGKHRRLGAQLTVGADGAEWRWGGASSPATSCAALGAPLIGRPCFFSGSRIRTRYLHRRTWNQISVGNGHCIVEHSFQRPHPFPAHASAEAVACFRRLSHRNRFPTHITTEPPKARKNCRPPKLMNIVYQCSQLLILNRIHEQSSTNSKFENITEKCD